MSRVFFEGQGGGVGGSVSLTSEVTGILPVANGGTAANTLTDHGVLIGNAANPITALAEAAVNQVLIGVSGAPPAFSNSLDLPGTLAVTGATTLDSTLSVGGDTVINGTAYPLKIKRGNPGGAGYIWTEWWCDSAMKWRLRSTDVAGDDQYAFQLQNAGPTITAFSILQDGKVGININDGIPTHMLDVDGDGRFTGDLDVDGDLQVDEDISSDQNITAVGNLVSAGGDLVLTATNAPGATGTAGIVGTITRDADYIYVCTQTSPSVWKRVAIATW